MVQRLVPPSVDLSEADLSHVDFYNSYMPGAWFFNSNLTEVSFVDADLRGATLRGCRLHAASLVRAKLDGTGIEDADLTNAVLAQVIVRDVAKFEKTNWWEADFYLPSKEHLTKNY